MSLLPTAHAGQSFGARRIDFFTVSGEVTESDAGTGRVIDGDGVTHDIRLAERSSAFAKGDTASVLRVQSGPNRRSRPVAIINHSRALWMRAEPDATTLLARSGVTRTLNWWLSVLALALLAIAIAWPSLHGFLTELNGPMMAGIPAFDIYAQLGALSPGVESWRLETALSPGLFDAISALGFVPMAQLTEWALFAGAAILTVISFLARSWRLLYVPALALLTVFAGAILGSPVVSLLMIAGAVTFFTIGGFINRVRDGGRFNARVARLAEYILSHPPGEGVRSSAPARDEVTTPAPLAAAAAATAIAAASAVAEGDDSAEAATLADDAPEAEAALAAEDVSTVEAAAAEPADSATNGEVGGDAVAQDHAPDAPQAASDTETDADEAVSAAPETGEGENSEAGDEDSGSVDQTPATDAGTAETQSETEAASPDDAPVATDDAQSTAPAETDSEADDELPSLEAVAAAAAVSDSERTGEAAAARADTPLALDDDRTMAVAAPPPMPAPAAPVEAAAAETAEEELAVSDQPSVSADVSETRIDMSGTDSLTAGEPEAVVADEAAAAATPAAAQIDDPMIDDDSDPMMEKASGDFAPGAPELDVDRDPAK